MLERLKNLNIDRINIDDIVELLTFGSAMKATYASNQLEVPEWLSDSLETLTAEMKSRRRDQLAGELKAAQRDIEKLKTADEKRAEAKAKIERITAALANA